MEPRGIYIRVSTSEQAADDKISVPNQLKDCKALCERKGYQVVDNYIDDKDYVATHGGSKGKMVSPSSKRRDRPEYLRMIEDIKAGKLKGLVGWKWDRFGAGGGIYPLMDALEETPITIETVCEGEISPLMLSMLTSFRAQVLRDMHDRLSMSIKAKLENGEFWSGNRLYGYDMVDGNRIINEEEAKWVRLIFELYTDGVGVREIRKRLITGKAEQKGHSSTKRPWGEGVIRAILKNPAYTGRATIEWDGQTYEITYPAIIDKRTFEETQRILAKNRTWPNRNTKMFYLLSGLLRCAHCGNIWHSTGKRYRYRKGKRIKRKTPLRYYRCWTAAHYPEDCPHKTPVRAEILEERVWRAVSEALRNPDMIWAQVQHRIEKLRENRAERTKEAEKLKGKLTDLQEERKWLILQARKGTITQADFEVQIALMDTEQAELELAYREAAQDIPDEIAVEKLERFVEQFFQDYNEKLDRLDHPPEDEWEEAMEKRKEVLGIVVDEIIIDPVTYGLKIVGIIKKIEQFKTKWPRRFC